MSTTRNLSWSILVFFLTCTHAIGQAVSALHGTERQGLHLGTWKQALLDKHPRMFHIPNETQSAGSASRLDVYLEPVTNSDRSDGRLGLFYFFKDDFLRAVSVTRGFAAGQEEQSEKYLDKIYGHLAETMTWVGNEETLRTNGLEGFVVTAERWKSKTDGTELYFVATNQEVTTVQFDPKHVSRKDFLADPEWKTKVDENGRRLRARIPPEVLERDAKKGQTNIVDAPRPFDPRTSAGPKASSEGSVNLESSTYPVAGSKEGSLRSVIATPTPTSGGMGGFLPWLSLVLIVVAFGGAVLWLRLGNKER